VWGFCVGEPKGWCLDLSVKEQKAIKGGQNLLVKAGTVPLGGGECLNPRN